MIIKTKIFELYDGHYSNLSELARVMGISVSQIYRVRENKRSINQKFIVGAKKAFPGYKLDDLFYFVSESPTVTDSRHQGLTKGQATKGKQRVKGMRQALPKSASTIDHPTTRASAITNPGEAFQQLRKNAEGAGIRFQVA